MRIKMTVYELETLLGQIRDKTKSLVFESGDSLKDVAETGTGIMLYGSKPEIKEVVEEVKKHK